MAFNIVLVNPEIPQNTGNIARSCADGETGDGLGQQFSICIHNIAAPGRNNTASRPLAHAPRGQFSTSCDLQIRKTNDHAKKKEEESAHQQDHPLSYGGSR